MSVGRFRKKPVVIEAMRYDGPETCAEIHAWIRQADYHGECKIAWEHGYGFNIYTLEGPMQAKPGDWIIKGVKGEFYPVKPDIFSATYEPINEVRIRFPVTVTETPTTIVDARSREARPHDL